MVAFQFYLSDDLEEHLWGKNRKHFNIVATTEVEILTTGLIAC